MAVCSANKHSKHCLSGRLCNQLSGTATEKLKADLNQLTVTCKHFVQEFYCKTQLFNGQHCGLYTLEH